MTEKNKVAISLKQLSSDIISSHDKLHKSKLVSEVNYNRINDILYELLDEIDCQIGSILFTEIKFNSEKERMQVWKHIKHQVNRS